MLELISLSPFLFRANPYFRKESLRYRCRLAEKKETGYHKDTRDSYTYSNFCSILLSSRLYCRFWNRTKSAAHRGSRTLPPVRNCTSPRRIFFLFGTIIYLLFSDFKLFPEKILFQKTVPHRALFVDMYFADLTAVSDEISVPAFRKRFNTQRSIEPAPKATARNICDLFGVVLCFKNKK